MEYKINIDLLMDQSVSSRDSIDRCIISTHKKYTIKFITSDKRNKNNSILTNIVKLNNTQFLNIFTKIMNLNTNLSKKPIGQSKIYTIKMTNEMKKLNR